MQNTIQKNPPNKPCFSQVTVNVDLYSVNQEFETGWEFTTVIL